MMRMVAGSGTTMNTVSEPQFAQLMRLYNKGEFDGEPGEDENLGHDTYEHEFTKESLGFSVRNVFEIGTIVVSKLTDPALEGILDLGDTVIAVNGAPLGWVTDPRVLAEKVKPLSRPVKISFARGEGAEAEGGGAPATAIADKSPVPSPAKSRAASSEEPKQPLPSVEPKSSRASSPPSRSPAARAPGPYLPEPRWRLQTTLRDLGPVSALALGPPAAPAAPSPAAADFPPAQGQAPPSSAGPGAGPGLKPECGKLLVAGRGDEHFTIWDLDTNKRVTS